MSANGTLYVGRCGLASISLCHWESDPCTSEDAAREALRAHIDSHRHADLVTFASAHMETIIKYLRESAS